ncbi:MAG: hypothetical protein AAF724_17285 [Pseudomonadota bacterium]
MIGLLLAPFQLAAAYGRWLLVGGLVAAIAFPGLAAFMEAQLPKTVALLLFLSALRVGPREALGAARKVGDSIAILVILQVLCPLLFAGFLVASGWNSPLALGLALMLAAAPISGSPSLAFLLGKDAAPALRLLIMGTAFLPLTTIPVFWLLPELLVGGSVFGATFRLLAIIVIASAAAFAVRGLFLKDPEPSGLKAIEGMAALTMAVMVIGLMAAIRPAIWENPGGVAVNLLAAFAANFGLQATTYLLLRKHMPGEAVAVAISAGNRNIALFLAVFPATAIEPLLLFVGCYQVPMYLTPVLLGRLYR